MSHVKQRAKLGLKVSFQGLRKVYRKLLRAYEKLGDLYAFRRCMAQSKPYFGAYMAARQGMPRRHWYMQHVVELECLHRDGSHYAILEIGSWAGGSAVTWAEAIKRHNNRKGLVLCLDPWVPYLDTNLERAGPYAAMNSASREGKILELFIHNIRTSGHEDIVRFIRGSTDELLPMLAQSTFDLIFLDGAHTYEQVLKDLKNSAPLLRGGGILCGDDLELQAEAIDREYARKNLCYDFIRDPKRGQDYHPGVTLAVGEFFGGEVSVWEGFFAMRKRECASRPTKWERVIPQDFDPASVRVPQHLL